MYNPFGVLGGGGGGSGGSTTSEVKGSPLTAVAPGDVNTYISVKAAAGNNYTLDSNAGILAVLRAMLWTFGQWGGMGGVFTLQGASGGGGNVDRQGYSMVIAGGISSGNAAGSEVRFATAPSGGSSGSTEKPAVVQMTVKENGVINFANCPTSSAGLSSGDIYSTAGALMIVP